MSKFTMKANSLMPVWGNRKELGRQARRLAASLMIGLAAISCVAQAGEEQRSEPSSSIEGSWIFEVTRINDLSASFRAVASFTAGGVFLATGSNDRVVPVSPLYGSWKRTERNLYISTTHFFAFDPTGKAVAMLKAIQTFKLKSHNELVGVGEAWGCDVQGQNCQRAPFADITIHGTRIIPQNVTELPLPD